MRRRGFSLGLWVVLLCACGNVYVDGSLPTSPPTISSFTATPASFDAGGGTSQLAWAVVNETSLYLSPDAGDVTGLTGWVVSPTVTTTYTLTAENALGYTQGQVTITVAP